MDGSLASLFLDGTLPSLPISWTSTGESTEELQFELARASMELESAKAEALAQEKLQEARLLRLQEQLNTITMERDEARQECLKLQERLRKTSLSPADSPCSFFHSMSSSPSSCVPPSPDHPSDLHSWGFHDIPSQSPHLSVPPSASHDMDLHQADLPPVPFSHGTDVDDLQALFALDPNKNPIVTSDSSQQFSMDVLDEDLLLDQEQSLDLTELQEESFSSVMEAKSSTHPPTGRTLSRQSSSNSTSASVPQHLRSVGGPPEDSTPIPSHGPFVCSSPETLPKVPTGNAFSSTTLATPVASMVRLVDSPRIAYPLKRVHLPEPPESDPQVMLGSLPEKGKLLQAVLQAGPLLQTLLLAGPLPQWRHPPPALSNLEIPKVSVSSNNVLFPFATPAPTFVPSQAQIFGSGYGLQSPALVPSPVYFRGGTAVRSDPSLVDNRTASPCSRSRKLRKLSSAVLYGDQMMAGGVRLAAGAADFASIW